MLFCDSFIPNDEEFVLARIFTKLQLFIIRLKSPLLQKGGLNLGMETDPKPIRKTLFVGILVINLRKIKIKSRKRSNVFPMSRSTQSCCSVLPYCSSEA